jgi:hypothetical protein
MTKIHKLSKYLKNNVKLENNGRIFFYKLLAQIKF